MTGQSGTSTKKVRGRSQRSLTLANAMYAAAEAAQPITGRGIGYKMFVAGLIPSMSRRDMRIIYRLLLEARERDDIPWDWIVDETRLVERVATWDDADQFASDMASEYRHNFWKEQPNRVEVWSEKGTVGGVLRPTLREYGVDFRIMHGFGSATVVHDVAQDYDGRDLVALYVGDFDPSGLYMSERDLPDRLAKYDGGHVILKRVALKRGHTAGLPSFPAADKTKDPRHKWFVQNHGHDCWELDAMDPNTLRDLVEEAIKAEIEPEAWKRCATVNKATQESMRSFLDAWTHRDAYQG